MKKEEVFRVLELLKQCVETEKCINCCKDLLLLMFKGILSFHKVNISIFFFLFQIYL